MGTLSASDAVLWAIEKDPLLRSTVVAVAYLDRAPNLALLTARLRSCSEAFPRLHQRIVAPAAGVGRPRWVDIPGFDPASRVWTSDAGGQGGRWVLDVAATWGDEGIDEDGPLWEFAVVTGLEGGRAALMQKFHHALTDGVGGIELMRALVDRTRQVGPLDTGTEHPPPATAAGGTALASSAPDRFLDTARWFTGFVTHSALNPWQSAAAAWATGRSVIRLLAPARHPLSPVFRTRSSRSHFDTLDYPLDDLRRAAAGAGGTVNDVFLAAITGGLARYHDKLGHPIDALRLDLPVSLRRPGDRPGGNRFTPVRFVVPVGPPDPVLRVRQLGDMCRRWRAEPALPLTEAIAGALSVMPNRLTTSVMGSLMYGVDFVATNVPGVPDRCYLAGARVLSQFAFAPTAGSAVNVALVSHGGTACIGVNTDVSAVPEPDLLVACLADSFGEVIDWCAPGPCPSRPRRRRSHHNS